MSVIHNKKRKFQKYNRATTAVLLDSWGVSFDNPTAPTDEMETLSIVPASAIVPMSEENVADEELALALALSASLAASATTPNNTPNGAANSYNATTSRHVLARSDSAWWEEEETAPTTRLENRPGVAQLRAYDLARRYADRGATYIRRSLCVSKAVAAAFRTKRNDLPNTRTASPKANKTSPTLTTTTSSPSTPGATTSLPPRPCAAKHAHNVRHADSTPRAPCSSTQHVSSRHGTRGLRHDPTRHLVALQRLIASRDTANTLRGHNILTPAIPDNRSTSLPPVRAIWHTPRAVYTPASTELSAEPEARLTRGFFRSLNANQKEQRLGYAFVYPEDPERFRRHGLMPLKEDGPVSYSPFYNPRQGFASAECATQYETEGTIYLCAVLASKFANPMQHIDVTPGSVLPLVAYSFTREPRQFAWNINDKHDPLDFFYRHCKDPLIYQYGLGYGRLRNDFSTAPGKSIDWVGFLRRGLKQGARRVTAATRHRSREAGRVSRTVAHTLAE